MAETRKAHDRRVREGFFEKYIYGEGIDIGCGRIDTFDGVDLLHPSAIAHDKDMCDAVTMEIYEDNRFDYVYASHILEHLEDPVTAIKNWFRILKPGGYLIISVPHRDLYEKKRTLPSLWNRDHKFFLLPEKCDPPNTFSFKGLIESALGFYSVTLNIDALSELSCEEVERIYKEVGFLYFKPGVDRVYEMIEFEVRSEGWFECPVDVHSSGEISIEAVIKKL